MRNFLKYTAISFVMSAASVGVIASAHDDSSDQKTVSKTYDFVDFDSISIGGVFEVDVNVGGSYGISLSGPEKEMDRIEVYSEGGTLHLDTKKKSSKHRGHNSSEGIEVTISLPDLESLRVSGVASGDVSGVDAGDFDLRVSGVAEVEIEGRCNNLDAKVSGVGELDARNFKCKNSEVTLSGVGEISVYASDSVDVTASGVGEVNVYGNPQKVDKSKSFFTTINIK